MFHKNLKIFKDPDFSENPVFDTVFHALSIGHKIRAVRNLWKKLWLLEVCPKIIQFWVEFWRKIKISEKNCKKTTFMQHPNYRRKFSIFDPINIAMEEDYLKNFRCKFCFSKATTKQNLLAHEKICQNGTIYKFIQKEYGSDLKTAKKLGI